MAQQSNDFADLPLRRQRAERAAKPLGFWGTAGAVFVGVTLAGLVLGFGVRLYVHWSVADTARQVNDKLKERAPERDEKGKR